MIKEIERQQNITDYKSYVIDELSEDLGVDKNLINVKVVINNSKFRTVRCIVNLDEETTAKVVKRNYVKIGFMRCSIERTFKVFNCMKCHRLDHRTDSCKDGEHCGLCSTKHNVDQTCPAKEDRSKTKCINCGDNHPSFFCNCPARIKMLEKLISRSAC